MLKMTVWNTVLWNIHINVVGKKMTRNGLKMVISIVTIHLDKSDFNLIVLAPWIKFRIQACPNLQGWYHKAGGNQRNETCCQVCSTFQPRTFYFLVSSNLPTHQRKRGWIKYTKALFILIRVKLFWWIGCMLTLGLLQ